MLSEELRAAIAEIAREITARLDGTTPTIYIFGSVALNDYRHGWSDIDMLCLTPDALTRETAEKLVNLRKEIGGKYARKFEGGILSREAFISGEMTTAVYWGTNGERVTDSFALDAFSMWELVNRGIHVCGEDIGKEFKTPDYSDMRRAVKRHLSTIRAHAKDTGASLYSHGWLLDISRCLYTLETGQVAAKTLAGEWALARGLCPDAERLARAVEIRKSPESFDPDEAAHLENAVQRYADVLENALTLKAENATETDMAGWLNLVVSVADNFPGLYLPDYKETLVRNIARKTALCVKVNGEIIAVLLCSPSKMCLSCMCVKPEYRRIGAASALISKMLTDMPEGDISVTTFREGDPMGVAPRALYSRFGFEPSDLTEEFDYPVQLFVLKNERRRK